MPRLLIVFFYACITSFCFGQVQLVKDINPDVSELRVENDYTQLFAKSGNLVYFPILDEFGRELWKSDGTTEGTSRIMDLNPGISDGVPSFKSSINFNDKLIFAGNDGVSGLELWITDGSKEGTKQILDISPGSGSSSPQQFFKFKNEIWFFANDGTAGTELWKTDGTTAGTQRAFDLTPGIASTNFLFISHGTNKFYFFLMPKIPNVYEFWQSDGTLAGTTKVKDFTYVAGSVLPGNSFMVVNEIAYLTANENATVNRLWRSDGTPAGTYSIESGGINYSPQSFTSFNNKLMFSLVNSNISTTNGDIFAAQLLTSASGYYASAVIGGNFFGIGLNALVKSDGTASGTTITPVGPVTSTGELVFINNKIILPYNVGATDKISQELGVYDINSGVVSLLKDIYPGSNGSMPRSFIKVNDSKILFIANDGVHGYELWETDGTTFGTKLFLDGRKGTSDAFVSDPFIINNQLYFVASHQREINTYKLWKTSGDEASTQVVTNFQSPFKFGLLSDEVIIFDKRKVSRTNGVSGITQDLFDFTGLASSFSLYSNSYSLGGKLFFWLGTTSGSLNSGTEPWITDGTPSGTHILKDINAGAASSSVTPAAIDLNSELFFLANDGSTGAELWKSDGTGTGTVLLKDINMGTAGSTPSNFARMANIIYFSAEDASNGRELWKSDGTTLGTVLVKDIYIGTTGSTPTNLVTLNNNLYLFAKDNTNLFSLWKTDGSDAGTSKIKSFGTSVGNLTVIGDKLYFSANDGVHGNAVWVSDGTQAGTNMIEINEESTSAEYNAFTYINGSCYFAGDGKLWKSGGTTESTISLSELLPTTILVNLDGWIYFGATTQEYGNELFKIKSKLSQIINFSSLEEKKVTDGPFTLSATSSASLGITYTSSDPGVASVSGNQITIHKAGSTQITASQSGNGDYDYARDVARQLMVSKNSQMITFNSIASKLASDLPFSLTAQTSSGLAITYTSSDPSIASITGNMVTIKMAGLINITASQHGNEEYEAATDAVRSLTINKSSQTIAFNSIAEKSVSDLPFALTAHSTSGLTVSFLSSSSKISLTNNQVTVLSAGRVAITANQTGNESYHAASPVEQSFCIKPVKPTVTISSNAGVVTLSSSSTTGNQWFFNGAAITGANNTTLTPSIAGIYKVQVKADDCSSDFSSEASVIITGDIADEASGIFAYPNPTSDYLRIVGLQKDTKLCTVLDGTGKSYPMNLVRMPDHHVADVKQFSKGLYLLQIEQGNSMKRLKFIKQD